VESRATPIKGAHSSLSDLTSLSLLRNSPPAAFAPQPMPSFEDLTNTPTSTRSSSSSIVHTTKASRANSKFKMSGFFCDTCNQVFTKNDHPERQRFNFHHSSNPSTAAPNQLPLNLPQNISLDPSPPLLILCYICIDLHS
jgi:hypothetical protein